MPEGGREVWCESGRRERKTSQQGEVRPGHSTSFLKMAFVTWQQQSFLFSSSIELLSANRSEPKQPCLLPRVWLRVWLHSGKHP